MNSAMSNLKVLTLNCWGILGPIGCKLRNERMAAIAKELSKGGYDLVLLQEVWVQSDYENLCDSILPVMKYTHYFHSGMFGSGVCLFSKYPIAETFQHRFSLNGYAHKILHGDWFGGKSIGLAQILVNDVKINVYSTHLHAKYSEEDQDEYNAHRIVQAYEMGQFIKHTSETCDAVIVAGDFNLTPDDLGLKLILTNANVKDAWTSQKEKKDINDKGNTCDRKDNSFSSAKNIDQSGKRLDYILYRSNTGFDIVCEQCNVTMSKVPGAVYNYSDHEGVEAVFQLKRNITAMAPMRDTGEIEKSFMEALPLLDDGLKKVKADQVFYAVAMLICFVALSFTSNVSFPLGLDYLISFVRILITIEIGFCFWMSIVMAKREINGIKAAKKDINNLLKSNS